MVVRCSQGVLGSVEYPSNSLMWRTKCFEQLTTLSFNVQVGDVGSKIRIGEYFDQEEFLHKAKNPRPAPPPLRRPHSFAGRGTQAHRRGPHSWSKAAYA